MRMNKPWYKLRFYGNWVPVMVHYSVMLRYIIPEQKILKFMVIPDSDPILPLGVGEGLRSFIVTLPGDILSLVTRKPVFGVCDQLRLKPACSTDETSYGLEVSAIAS